MADYTQNPIVHKYMGRLHDLIDELHTETEGLEPEPQLTYLRECLVTIFERFTVEDGLEELDSILRMHFGASYGDECDLTAYILSTEN